jgi:hypothetical protein
VDSVWVVAPRSTIARRRYCSTLHCNGGGCRRGQRQKKVVAARAVARRGTTTLRVSAVEKSGSDYHVSGEGLPRNCIDVLSHGGYNI